MNIVCIILIAVPLIFGIGAGIYFYIKERQEDQFFFQIIESYCFTEKPKNNIEEDNDIIKRTINKLKEREKIRGY